MRFDVLAAVFSLLETLACFVPCFCSPLLSNAVKDASLGERERISGHDNICYSNALRSSQKGEKEAGSRRGVLMPFVWVRRLTSNPGKHVFENI